MSALLLKADMRPVASKCPLCAKSGHAPTRVDPNSGHCGTPASRRSVMTARNSSRPIARVFRATAAPGCRDELLQRFRSSSAALVNSKVGCLKYRILEPVDTLAPEVVFESIWWDLDAVKVAFGDAWQQSHLPEGYSALMTAYSVHHFLLARVRQRRPPRRPTWSNPAPGAVSSSRILARSNGRHVRFGSKADTWTSSITTAYSLTFSALAESRPL